MHVRYHAGHAEAVGITNRIYAVIHASSSEPGVISVTLSGRDVFDQDVKLDMIQISDRLFANDPETPVLDKNGLRYSMAVDVPDCHFAFAFVTTPLRRDSTEEQSNGSLWPSVLDPLLKGFPFEEGNDRRKKTKNKPVPYYLKFSGAFGSKR